MGAKANPAGDVNGSPEFGQAIVEFCDGRLIGQIGKGHQLEARLICLGQARRLGLIAIGNVTDSASLQQARNDGDTQRARSAGHHHMALAIVRHDFLSC